MNLDFLQKPIKKKAALRLFRRIWREGLLVFLVILLGVSFFQTNTLLEKVRIGESVNEETKNDVARLKIEVETLISESAENTKAEIEKRLLEEQIKISNLQNALSSETQKRKDLEGKLANETPAEIITEWRKRTGRVVCQFPNGTSRGSGVLTFYDGGDGARYGVLTNKHVVTINGRVARSCTVTFADSNVSFTSTAAENQIQTSTKGYDFARLLAPSVTPFITSTAAPQSKFCSIKPSSGDGVVILGYPVIGSGNDITATDGIVSGDDGDYYVTSAKVEQGNSGGSAILVRNNCLLGIPTFVELGNVESLARILKISIILN